jgi:hypothetical protein
VCQAGEDDVRAELPDEAKQPGGAVPYPRGVKLMDRNVWREARGVVTGGNHQGKVDFVFAGAEVAGKDFDDVFGSPATEVWNEQKNPGRFSRRHDLAR